jgi:hypothetical protein
MDVFRSVREVVADAAHAAVIRHNPATVAMCEATDEILSGLLDELLLPTLESDQPVCFLPRTMLRQQSRPVFAAKPDFDAIIGTM